jgi:hypothetical protein
MRHFKVGFDYPAIFAYAEIMKISINPIIMNRLQLLEQQELEEVAKKNGR